MRMHKVYCMENFLLSIIHRIPSTPRGRASRVQTMYTMHLNSVFYKNHFVKLVGSILSKDCCMIDFVRSHLTLNKPSWASRTLLESLHWHWATDCVDPLTLSSKNLN